MSAGSPTCAPVASFGYKFSGLSPSTTYVLSVRAYHLVNGTKVYSPEASLTTSTLDGTTPPDTTTTTTTTTDVAGRSDHDDHVAANDHDRPGGSGSARISGPTARTATTISVHLYRTPDSGMVCQPDYGYEVRAGLGGSWVDAGGFANVCSSASFGYKFNGLSPSTNYVLSVRAYHLVNGTKVYSPEASLTTSTLDGDHAAG